MEASPLTVRAICEGALQLIGSYSVRDTGADGDELRRAADWFDDVLKHTHARKRDLWLRRQGTIALQANTPSYDLISAMGVTAPVDGFMYPISAYVRDGQGNDSPVDIIRLENYDAIEDKDETGDLCLIAIDRLVASPRLYVHRVPATTGAQTLYLRYATFNPNPSGKAVEDRTSGLRATWSLWAKYKLASVIGDGAVRKLRDDEVKNFAARAEELYGELLAFEDQEHASEPRRTEPWGL